MSPRIQGGVEQPGMAPTNKVSAATLAAAASALIVFGAGKAGLEFGPLEAGAITTLLVGVAGYFKREKE